MHHGGASDGNSDDDGREDEEQGGGATSGEMQLRRVLTLLQETVGEDGLISEADYICSTLLDMGLVDSTVLFKVREQFYRLDGDGSGVLSMAGYRRMADIKSGVGNAKARWRYAAGMTVKEQRVIGVLQRLSQHEHQAANPHAPPGEAVHSRAQPQTRPRKATSVHLALV